MRPNKAENFKVLQCDYLPVADAAFINRPCIELSYKNK